MRLYDQNPIARCRGAGAGQVVHQQRGTATDGTAVDHQPVGGGTIARQHAVQPQRAASTHIVALDRQATRRVVAAREVQRTRVDHAHALAGGERQHTTVAGAHHTVAVDIQAATATARITQHQGIVQGQGAVAQRDLFETRVQGAAAGLAAVEGQAVVAQPALHRGDQRGARQPSQQRCVVARPHVHAAADGAAVPGEAVVARAQ